MLNFVFLANSLQFIEVLCRSSRIVFVLLIIVIKSDGKPRDKCTNFHLINHFLNYLVSNISHLIDSDSHTSKREIHNKSWQYWIESKKISGINFTKLKKFVLLFFLFFRETKKENHNEMDKSAVFCTNKSHSRITIKLQQKKMIQLT